MGKKNWSFSVQSRALVHEDPADLKRLPTAVFLGQAREHVFASTVKRGSMTWIWCTPAEVLSTATLTSHLQNVNAGID